MKKLVIIIAIIILVLAVVLSRKPSTDMSVSEQEQAEQVVHSFATHLKNVSLTAPNEILIPSLQNEYSPYVTSALLERWIEDPIQAPGRETSSPWPEKIEIKTIEKVGDYYEISGEVVWMTSTEITSGGDAGRTPVYLTLANIDGQWKIAEYQTSME